MRSRFCPPWGPGVALSILVLFGMSYVALEVARFVGRVLRQPEQDLLHSLAASALSSSRPVAVEDHDGASG